jgi:hypothetical protein
VNTSRGPVIDETALARSLKEHWIAGAALDVYEREPLPPDSPLRDPELEDRCRLIRTLPVPEELLASQSIPMAEWQDELCRR